MIVGIMSKSLDAETMGRLILIFNKKGWAITNEDMSLFDRFCIILNLLGKDEQLLFLELTDRFLWVGFEQYVSRIVALLKTLSVDASLNFNSYSNLIIFPLISPSDLNKNKSSKMVQYLLRSVVIPHQSFIRNKSLYFPDNVNDLKTYSGNENSLILLVDDFVGTGDTAIKAINFLTRKGIPTKDMVVFSLIAMKQSIAVVQGLGLRIFATEFLDKAISGYYVGQSLAKNIKLMESIEKTIRVKDNERFGYKQSEALVTMIRTPNNTFPVFWYDKKTRKVHCPFPRYVN